MTPASGTVVARTLADDSQPQLRAREPTRRACASLHPYRPQPRYWLAPSTRATCDGRLRHDGARAISLGRLGRLGSISSFTCSKRSTCPGGSVAIACWSNGIGHAHGTEPSSRSTVHEALDRGPESNV